MKQSGELLIGLIYDELLTKERWHDFLQLLRHELCANSVVLILRHPTEANSGVILQNGIDQLPAQLGENEYSAGMYKQNPFLNFTKNKALLIDDILDRKELLKTQFYKDLLKPNDIYHIMGAELRYDSEVDATLYLTRHKKTDRFNTQHLRKLNRYIPHLIRALRIAHRLEILECEASFYSQLFMQFNAAIVLLDSERKVVHVNQLGKALANAENGFEIKRAKMVIADHKADKNFQELCEMALDEYIKGNNSFLDAITVKRRFGQPLVFLIRPMPTRQQEAKEADPVVAVIIIDPALKLETSYELLQKLFGLTASEGKLVLHLVNGDNVDQAANHMGISINTARAHLRSIFLKLDVNSQQQLIRLITRIGNVPASNVDPTED